MNTVVDKAALFFAYFCLLFLFTLETETINLMTIKAKVRAFKNVFLLTPSMIP